MSDVACGQFGRKWQVSEIICGFFMCCMCELVGIYKLFMFFNLMIN